MTPYRFIISTVLILFASSYAQNENTPRETSIDYTRQFWMESRHAITDSFLIKVFLPPDYFKSDTTHFPVLFVTDADAFWGAATDYAWELHFGNPKHIIVGISYGAWSEGWAPNWKREIDFSNRPNEDGIVGAEGLLKFFNAELIPKIESEYRTDKGNRTLFGWSSGASFATYVLFSTPDAFHNYLILGYAPENQDDPLWKLEQSYFFRNKSLPVKLFMGVGTYDAFYFTMKGFVEHIKGHSYRNLQITFEPIEHFSHSYETAVALMAKGLQSIFVKPSVFVRMLQLVEEQGVDKALQTYHQIKRTELENYSFNENDLNDVGYYLLNSQRIDAALRILRLNAEEYPKSANVYDSLADAYMAAGDKQNAQEYVSKTLKVLEEYPDGGEKEKIKRLSQEKLIKIRNMKR